MTGVLAVFTYRKPIREVKGGQYGGDVTRVCMEVGVDYRALVRQSRNLLAGPWSVPEVWAALEARFESAKAIGWNGRGGKAVPALCIAADLLEARRELIRSYGETLDRPPGLRDAEGRSYAPLAIDHREIPGARSWRDAEGNVGIELTGQIIGRRVVEAGAREPTKPRSSPVVVAKEWLRQQLPVSRYVMYAPKIDAEILWGKAAEEAAEVEGLFEQPQSGEEGE